MKTDTIEPDLERSPGAVEEKTNPAGRASRYCGGQCAYPGLNYTSYRAAGP